MIEHVIVQYEYPGPRTCNEVYWLGAGDWSTTTNERNERARNRTGCVRVRIRV